MSIMAYALSKAGLISERKAEVQSNILPLIKTRKIILKDLSNKSPKEDKIKVSILNTRIKIMNKELNNLR